jgi:hypothetical protein
MVSEADWTPYEEELRVVFGFSRASDPDPSEWFPIEDFDRFRPYLEALRTETRAQTRVDETHGSRADRGEDRSVEALDEDHDKASGALASATKELMRLEGNEELGRILLRAKTKLNESRRPTRSS